MGLRHNDAELYLRIAKKLAVDLPDEKDRVLALKWLKFLQKAVDAAEKKTKLHATQLLLICLQRKRLVGPFVDAPAPGKKLLQYGWAFQPADIARLILKLEFEKIGKTQFVVDIAGDLCEYVATQEIPQFGAHFFYAFSPEQMRDWDKFNKAYIPKGFLSVSTAECPEASVLASTIAIATPEKRAQMVVPEGQKKRSEFTAASMINPATGELYDDFVKEVPSAKALDTNTLQSAIKQGILDAADLSLPAEIRGQFGPGSTKKSKKDCSSSKGKVAAPHVEIVEVKEGGSITSKARKIKNSASKIQKKATKKAFETIEEEEEGGDKKAEFEKKLAEQEKRREELMSMMPERLRKRMMEQQQKKEKAEQKVKTPEAFRMGSKSVKYKKSHKPEEFLLDAESKFSQAIDVFADLEYESPKKPTRKVVWVGKDIPSVERDKELTRLGVSFGVEKTPKERTVLQEDIEASWDRSLKKMLERKKALADKTVSTPVRKAALEKLNRLKAVQSRRILFDEMDITVEPEEVHFEKFVYSEFPDEDKTPSILEDEQMTVDDVFGGGQIAHVSALGAPAPIEQLEKTEILLDAEMETEDVFGEGDNVNPSIVFKEVAMDGERQVSAVSPDGTPREGGLRIGKRILQLPGQEPMEQHFVEQYGDVVFNESLKAVDVVPDPPMNEEILNQYLDQKLKELHPGESPRVYGEWAERFRKQIERIEKGEDADSFPEEDVVKSIFSGSELQKTGQMTKNKTGISSPAVLEVAKRQSELFSKIKARYEVTKARRIQKALKEREAVEQDLLEPYIYDSLPDDRPTLLDASITDAGLGLALVEKPDTPEKKALLDSFEKKLDESLKFFQDTGDEGGGEESGLKVVYDEDFLNRRIQGDELPGDESIIENEGLDVEEVFGEGKVAEPPPVREIEQTRPKTPIRSPKKPPKKTSSPSKHSHLYLTVGRYKPKVEDIVPHVYVSEESIPSDLIFEEGVEYGGAEDLDSEVVPPSFAADHEEPPEEEQVAIEAELEDEGHDDQRIDDFLAVEEMGTEDMFAEERIKAPSPIKRLSPTAVGLAVSMRQSIEANELINRYRAKKGLPPKKMVKMPFEAIGQYVDARENLLDPLVQEPIREQLPGLLDEPILEETLEKPLVKEPKRKKGPLDEYEEKILDEIYDERADELGMDVLQEEEIGDDIFAEDKVAEPMSIKRIPMPKSPIKAVQTLVAHSHLYMVEPPLKLPPPREPAPVIPEEDLDDEDEPSFEADLEGVEGLAGYYPLSTDDEEILKTLFDGEIPSSMREGFDFLPPEGSFEVGDDSGYGPIMERFYGLSKTGQIRPSTPKTPRTSRSPRTSRAPRSSRAPRTPKMHRTLKSPVADAATDDVIPERDEMVSPRQVHKLPIEVILDRSLKASNDLIAMKNKYRAIHNLPPLEETAETPVFEQLKEAEEALQHILADLAGEEDRTPTGEPKYGKSIVEIFEREWEETQRQKEEAAAAKEPSLVGEWDLDDDMFAEEELAVPPAMNEIPPPPPKPFKQKSPSPAPLPRSPRFSHLEMPKKYKPYLPHDVQSMKGLELVELDLPQQRLLELAEAIQEHERDAEQPHLPNSSKMLEDPFASFEKDVEKELYSSSCPAKISQIHDKYMDEILEDAAIPGCDKRIPIPLAKPTPLLTPMSPKPPSPCRLPTKRQPTEEKQEEERVLAPEDMPTEDMFGDDRVISPNKVAMGPTEFILARSLQASQDYQDLKNKFRKTLNLPPIKEKVPIDQLKRFLHEAANLLEPIANRSLPPDQFSIMDEPVIEYQTLPPLVSPPKKKDPLAEYEKQLDRELHKSPLSQEKSILGGDDFEDAFTEDMVAEPAHIKEILMPSPKPSPLLTLHLPRSPQTPQTPQTPPPRRPLKSHLYLTTPPLKATTPPQVPEGPFLYEDPQLLQESPPGVFEETQYHTPMFPVFDVTGKPIEGSRHRKQFTLPDISVIPPSPASPKGAPAPTRSPRRQFLQIQPRSPLRSPPRTSLCSPLESPLKSPSKSPPKSPSRRASKSPTRLTSPQKPKYSPVEFDFKDDIGPPEELEESPGLIQFRKIAPGIFIPFRDVDRQRFQRRQKLMLANKFGLSPDAIPEETIQEMSPPLHSSPPVSPECPTSAEAAGELKGSEVWEAKSLEIPLAMTPPVPLKSPARVVVPGTPTRPWEVKKTAPKVLFPTKRLSIHLSPVERLKRFLAQQSHIKVEELPRKTEFSPRDFVTKVLPPREYLLEIEEPPPEQNELRVSDVKMGDLAYALYIPTEEDLREAEEIERKRAEEFKTPPGFFKYSTVAPKERDVIPINVREIMPHEEGFKWLDHFMPFKDQVFGQLPTVRKKPLKKKTKTRLLQLVPRKQDAKTLGYQVGDAPGTEGQLEKWAPVKKGTPVPPRTPVDNKSAKKVTSVKSTANTPVPPPRHIRKAPTTTPIGRPKSLTPPPGMAIRRSGRQMAFPEKLLKKTSSVEFAATAINSIQSTSRRPSKTPTSRLNPNTRPSATPSAALMKQLQKTSARPASMPRPPPRRMLNTSAIRMSQLSIQTPNPQPRTAASASFASKSASSLKTPKAPPCQSMSARASQPSIRHTKRSAASVVELTPTQVAGIVKPLTSILRPPAPPREGPSAVTPPRTSHSAKKSLVSFLTPKKHWRLPSPPGDRPRPPSRVISSTRKLQPVAVTPASSRKPSGTSSGSQLSIQRPPVPPRVAPIIAGITPKTAASSRASHQVSKITPIVSAQKAPPPSEERAALIHPHPVIVKAVKPSMLQQPKVVAPRGMTPLSKTGASHKPVLTKTGGTRKPPPPPPKAPSPPRREASVSSPRHTPSEAEAHRHSPSPTAGLSHRSMSPVTGPSQRSSSPAAGPSHCSSSQRPGSNATGSSSARVYQPQWSLIQATSSVYRAPSVTFMSPDTGASSVQYSSSPQSISAPRLVDDAEPMVGSSGVSMLIAPTKILQRSLAISRIKPLKYTETLAASRGIEATPSASQLKELSALPTKYLTARGSATLEEMPESSSYQGPTASRVSRLPAPREALVRRPEPAIPPRPVESRGATSEFVITKTNSPSGQTLLKKSVVVRNTGIPRPRLVGPSGLPVEPGPLPSGQGGQDVDRRPELDRQTIRQTMTVGKVGRTNAVKQQSTIQIQRDAGREGAKMVKTNTMHTIRPGQTKKTESKFAMNTRQKPGAPKPPPRRN